MTLLLLLPVDQMNPSFPRLRLAPAAQPRLRLATVHRRLVVPPASPPSLIAPDPEEWEQEPERWDGLS